MKPSPFLKFIGFFVIVVLSHSSLSAATLVNYQFNGNGVASITGQYFTASSASFVGYASQTGFSGSSGTAFVRADQTPASWDGEKYLTITLTAENGYQLNLTSFSFSLGGSTAASSTSNQVSHAQVRASYDDFATSFTLDPAASAQATVTVVANGANSGFSLFTVDLSPFAQASEVTFRIYGYTGGTRKSENFWRLGDISVEGSVAAIPEPSAIALLLGLAMWRGVRQGIRFR